MRISRAQLGLNVMRDLLTEVVRIDRDAPDTDRDKVRCRMVNKRSS